MIKNNIPASIMSKMDNYEVEILGAKIKVRVVKDYAVVGSKIDELKFLLQTLQNRVVGVDVKIDNPAVSSNDPFVVHLILCVGTWDSLPDHPLMPLPFSHSS